MSEKKEQSSLWGILAIVAALILFFTPQILATPVILATLIFAIIGLVKGSGRILSGIALAAVALVFFTLGEDALNNEKYYTVTYQVHCDECKATYTNETGGNSSITVRGRWSTKINTKGSNFVHLSAQNSNETGEVRAIVESDGTLWDMEVSSGAFCIASASGLAKGT